MHILLAFNAYKDALSAVDACALAAKTITGNHPGHSLAQSPLTDGGEGFAEILTQAAGGHLETFRVCGPLFTEVEAKMGFVALQNLPAAARRQLSVGDTGEIAVIEMAQASGIELIPASERNAWHTSTYGTGQLIAIASQRNVQAILLGIGGSATNDLGVGALEALGLLCYDRDLQPVTRVTPASWKQINTLGSTTYLQGLPPIRIACDVNNPLTGSTGATAVFGPQKGIPADEIPLLERQVHKMALRLIALSGNNSSATEALLSEPATGAAGGIGFGLKTALPDSRFIPGMELFANWMQLDEKIANADCIISGEGCFDASSVGGKGPYALLQRTDREKPFILLAGKLAPEVVASVKQTFPNFQAKQLSPSDWPLPKALKETPNQLKKAITEVLNLQPGEAGTGNLR